ncbi:DEAH-box RNA helicase prp16, partial [Dissophora globulifera]
MSGLEHDVAIDLSRALNLVNANDLLARQVIQIARNHKQVQGFVKACAAFGKFKDEFLFDVYTKILNHDREHGVNGPSPSSTTGNTNGRRSDSNNNSNDEPSGGMSNFVRGYDDDDTPAAPALPGGLIKKVRPAGDDRHVFKVPTVPVGVSRLGLDKLAKEKREARERAAAAAAEQQTDSKRIKLQVEDEWKDTDNSIEDSQDTEMKDSSTFSLS